MKSRVPTAPPKRKRYTPQEAKERILAAAEEAFLKGGVDAVKVQPLAAQLGITDAAIHYHFKNREGLLEALLRRCGRRLKDRFTLDDAAAETVRSQLDRVSVTLHDAFSKEGYAKLALWLYLSGWSPRGHGMLAPLAAQLHATIHGEDPASGSAINDEAQFALCLLHVVTAMESTLGGAFLKSVSLKDDEATRSRYRQWVIDLLADHLER